MDQAQSTYAVERARIAHRRRTLGIAGDAAPVVGLALSGGGIRSATFAFGVLQALATTRVHPPAGARNDTLLARIDYLSTVSGGSYIGGFLSSLFVPGRARIAETATAPPESALDAALRAYDIVACEPPPRIRREDDYATLPVGSAHTAWLRENGRYLTPTGAGDLLYGAVTQVRNWVAMQYVVGVTLVALFSLILLAGIVAERAVDAFAQADPGTAAALARHFPYLAAHPLWLVPLAVVCVGVLPAGIAFWFTHPQAGQNDGSPPALFTRATLTAAAIPVAIVVASAVLWTLKGQVTPSKEAGIALLAAILLVLSLAHYAIALASAPTIAAHRVTLTRDLVIGVELSLAASALLAVYSVGQQAYLELRAFSLPEVTVGATAGFLVWLVRRLATAVDGKQVPGWLRALPLDLVALAAALVLWALVGVAWAAVVQWWAFASYLATQSPDALAALPAHATFLFVVSFVLAWITGLFPGFVNLSTLHALYSARLTRAYLGASNGQRFTRAGRARGRSVAEPMPGDQLDVGAFYGPDASPTLAPVHLVNTTLNQTTDPAEQLVQRDRKGRPLALTPAGYTIDGALHDPERDRPQGEIDTRMSVGQWIGVSGAAVSTGLGRATSLGFSLLLGLANVRLGRWWRAPAQASGEGASRADGSTLVFRSQRLLWQEFTACFHGARRRWQYLSDGGHFENTGVYELLRPERGVSLIIACDDGADPAYRFGDLANLIRLARIDFGLDVEVDADAAGSDALAGCFMTRAEVSAREVPDDRCALLLNVYRRSDAGAARVPVCRIVVVKPRVIRDLPLDVQAYAATHPAFPQESTGDQFFDEAQWESYRKLGLTIGRRVLTPALLAQLGL